MIFVVGPGEGWQMDGDQFFPRNAWRGPLEGAPALPCTIEYSDDDDTEWRVRPEALRVEQAAEVELLDQDGIN